jgi:hypothetical protein
MPKPLLSHLRIVTAGPTHYLQHLILDGSPSDRYQPPPWRTLRPLRFGSATPDPTSTDPHAVLVGTPDAYEMYSLPVLVQTLLSPASAFDIDEEMPDPMPMPEPMRYLPDTTMTVLVRGALGYSTLEVDDYVRSMGLDLPTMRNEWEDAGIYLCKSSAAQPFIEGAKLAEIQRIESAVHAGIKNFTPSPNPTSPTADTTSPTADPTSPTADTTTYNSPSTDLPYGETRRLTPEQLEVYERRLRGDRNARRLKWPFSKMEIGDVVRIEPELATKGQRAAHAYSSASGRLFATTRLRNGDLEVVRISGFRIPSASKRTA